MHLWLDDVREPPDIVDSKPWTWVKSHEEAVNALRTGEVTFASLDHDLADEHYFALCNAGPTPEFKEKTGYDTLCYIEAKNIWPAKGIRIHTMNIARKKVMVDVVRAHYGKAFQFEIRGTHKV